MKFKNLTKGINLVLLLITALSVSVLTIVMSGNKNAQGTTLAAAGFDKYGYNNTARIFNGTGSSWCLAKALPADCLGIYSPDKLVMKWTDDWDRGNAEKWSNPPYLKAWTDNEWNGKGNTGGSGEIWHYKIVWVGPELKSSTYWRPGGYAIWGQFEVIMDQGQDPNVGPGHIWFTRASPAGYGAH